MNKVFPIIAVIFAIYYVIGLIVVAVKAGGNETGAPGYCLGILSWAFIWPIVLFL